MKVLVACEESQAVCIAFRNKGHEAYSCDILPCSGGHPEWHKQGYLEDIIRSGKEWDMIIAFPPCTYLCSSGLHWNGRVGGRQEKTEYALSFVQMIMNRDCPKIVVENPIGCISSRIRKPDQIIQPYNFGENASKQTCLWLKGLPSLKSTSYFPPRTVNGKKRWANQTDGGQNKLAPSITRAMERSKTYAGIAAAMAEQWS